MAETPRGEAIRVLNIDDEQDQLEFIKIFMADIDPTIKIESTTSTSEALKKLNESQYDCIICDYQMPEMNGVVLAKLDKKTPISSILVGAVRRSPRSRGRARPSRSASPAAPG